MVCGAPALFFLKEEEDFDFWADVFLALTPFILVDLGILKAMVYVLFVE